MAKYDSRKDANYDFQSQRQPKRNMGATSFANLPEAPIMRPFAKFGGEAAYRDGIANDFACGIGDVSQIYENHKGD